MKRWSTEVVLGRGRAQQGNSHPLLCLAQGLGERWAGGTVESVPPHDRGLLDVMALKGPLHPKPFCDSTISLVGQEETGSSCSRGGSGWIFGKNSAPKGWSGLGTDCPGQCWSHQVFKRQVGLALGDMMNVAVLGELLDLMILEGFSKRTFPRF